MDKKKWIPTQDAWLYFEGNVCTDIKVSTPGTSVRLEAPEFALRNCKRSFPSVKALIIPKGVKYSKLTVSECGTCDFRF